MSSFYYPLLDYYLMRSEYSYSCVLFQCLHTPCVFY